MISLQKKGRTLLNRLMKSSKYAIDYDNFDLDKFKYIKERSKALLETEEKGLREYEHFPELMQDTYDALFKNNPELLEEHQMKTEFMLNREIAEKLLDTSRYKELRIMTQFDELASALGTEVMGDELIEWLKQAKEQRQRLQDLVEAAAKMEAEQEKENEKNGKQGQAVGDELSWEPPQDGQPGPTPGRTLEKAMQDYEEALKKFKESTNTKNFAASIERIAAKVKDQVKESSDTISNWGLERSESFRRMPINEKMAMLERLRASDKLKQMAKLAGRYRRMALQVRREKVRKGMDSYHSVIQGNDLGRLLSSEWIRFSHRATKHQFFADFIEGKTLMYEIRGKEKKMKGPIICGIDSSGSMSGLPEIWAKSVAMALLEIARDQKRDFYVIHFSSGWRGQALHTNDFPKDKQFEVEQLLDMAEYFEGGGTEFEPPLNLARQKIGEEKRWSKADIIFITDGESAVTRAWVDDFNEWKKLNKVSIYSVLIDSSANSPSTLKLFSDKIEKLSNMKSDADGLAVSIFADI